MTLLYMDGFAHGQGGRYGAGSVLNFASTSTPRVSGGYYCNNLSLTGCERFITASSEVFTGIGWRFTSLANARTVFAFHGDTHATRHITIVINTSGLIEARRGTASGTLLATGATTLVTGAWYYIEARVTISDTVGVVQVRLNGSTSNEINFSGDTKNAGTATTIDAVQIAEGTGSNVDLIADWYICDTNGSTNNTWLGDVTVRVLTPNGSGNSSLLVGSDGNSVNNYQQVDELPYSSADYNGSATSSDKDSYTFSDLPAAVTTVYATQCGAFMAKSDASAKSAKILTRSGGTDYVPTTTTLTTSYVETLELRETDPATSAAWTPSAVNSAEFGMQVA